MAKKEEEQPAPKSKKKLMMVGGLGVLLLAGGVAAAVIMMKGGDGAEGPKSTADEISEDAGGEGGHGEAKADEHAEPKVDSHGNPVVDEHGGAGGSDGEAGPPWIHPFADPFTVNLFEPTNRWFLQMYLQIEASSPEVLKSIDRNIAPLRDTVILLLSSKTKKELSTMDGKLKLKQEIVIRIEAVLGKGSVKTVYFTEFTIMTM